MCSVDVDFEGRELVVERVTDVALRRQVIALVRLRGSNYLHQTGITLKRSGVQVNSSQQVLDPRQPVLRVFNRYPPYDAVNLVPFFQKQFRQVTSILPRYPGNKRSFSISQVVSRISRLDVKNKDWSAGKPTVLRQAHIQAPQHNLII